MLLDTAAPEMSAADPTPCVTVEVAPRLRRASTLIAHWKDGQLVLENYRTHQITATDATTMRVLSCCDPPGTAAEIAGRMPEYTPDTVAEALTQLAGCGLVVDADAADDTRLSTAWRHWGPEARYLHFGTRGTRFLIGAEQADYIAGLDGDPPPPFKRYPGAARILLPRIFTDLERPLGAVLADRRTTRAFGEAAVPLQRFSTLLATTFGPQLLVDAGAFGLVTFRAPASGGGRHETECYVGVLNVEGIAPGIYHYNSFEHSLELLRPGFTRAQAVRWASEQRWVEGAGAIVVAAARFERMMWKYRHAIAYRVLLMNLGHYGQTFSLVATALDLRPFVTAAIPGPEIDAALGLDGLDEASMYLFALGTPAPPGPHPTQRPTYPPLTRQPLCADFPVPTDLTPCAESGRDPAPVEPPATSPEATK